MAQETQTGALYQPRGVGWGGRWEGGSKGKGYMYTYGWFTLRFDRKQQHSVNQLSFNRKQIIFFKLLMINFINISFHCVSVQFSSVTQSCRLFGTPWIAARQASLSITNSRSSLKLTSIQSVMPSSHLILCRPLLLLPPIPPSIRVFSNESTLCMRWPNYWSFSFSIIPSKEHPGLISFRMDWLDILAVTLI